MQIPPAASPLAHECDSRSKPTESLIATSLIITLQTAAASVVRLYVYRADVRSL